MNAIGSLRESILWGHALLEMVMADVTEEQARWTPPGIANPIGAMYAHALLAVDGMVNGLLKGGAPRFATEWAGQLGDLPPQMQVTFDWARGLQPNLPALRQYGQTVMVDADQYLSQLSESDLDRVVDLSSVGLGARSVGWIWNALVASHLNNMAGEISALKGVQGLQGYPF
jgi:DinB family protein